MFCNSSCGTYNSAEQNHKRTISSQFRLERVNVNSSAHKSIPNDQDHEAETGSLFLTVSYMNPHSPLQVLEDDLRRVPSNITNEVSLGEDFKGGG